MRRIFYGFTVVQRKYLATSPSPDEDLSDRFYPTGFAETLTEGPKELTCFTLADDDGVYNLNLSVDLKVSGDHNLYMSVGPYINQANKAEGGVVSFEPWLPPETRRMTCRNCPAAYGRLLEMYRMVI